MTIESPKFEKKKINLTKKFRLNKLKKRVEETTDKLGMPIDAGIKEAVIAFNVWEFPTYQSCEGHFDKKGEAYPWVEILVPVPKGIKDNGKEEKERTLENLKHRKRMTGMLGEFYKERKTSSDAKLSFSNIGIYGGFRIQSAGAEKMPLFSGKEQKEKLKLYRKEMDDFAKFLKKRK